MVIIAVIISAAGQGHGQGLAPTLQGKSTNPNTYMCSRVGAPRTRVRAGARAACAARVWRVRHTHNVYMCLTFSYAVTDWTMAHSLHCCC